MFLIVLGCVGLSTAFFKSRQKQQIRSMLQEAEQSYRSAKLRTGPPRACGRFPEQTAEALPFYGAFALDPQVIPALTGLLAN